MVQGELVNGSVGQVVRFSTSEEAMKSATQVATEEGFKSGLSTNSEIPANYDNSQWPVVRFTSGRELLCIPTDFTVNNADGGTEARRRQVSGLIFRLEPANEREQIPLILAWALSVHKSQGQTLERVKVDLGRTFEKGQGRFHHGDSSLGVQSCLLSVRRPFSGYQHEHLGSIKLSPHQVSLSFKTCLSIINLIMPCCGCKSNGSPSGVGVA